MVMLSVTDLQTCNNEIHIKRFLFGLVLFYTNNFFKEIKSKQVCKIIWCGKPSVIIVKLRQGSGKDRQGMAMDGP